VPNAKNLVEQAKISPYHIGTWAYVYTIGYRPDSLKGVAFESWADLWRPEIKGKLAAPDFDPSHLIAVAAMLSGGDAATWEKGQAKLKQLKPSFKAYYTNDANSQQLIANGETPVQVILSMNAHYMASEGVPIQLVIPKEGAVLGIDSVAIMKGSKKADLAYKFINIALDPQVQAEVAKFKKGSPVVLDAKVDPDVAKLPGVFTTADQWNKQAIVIDHKLRAEKTAEWRKWFTENIIN
jgi:putative spermidine/putrescine transport system substrate-binding protein